MPIFSLLVVWLLPVPKYFHLFSGKGLGVPVVLISKTEGFLTREYRVTYCGCHEKIIMWHKSSLEKFDPDFRFQQAQLQLVEARMKADEQGIGPLDSRYPDLFDFLPFPETKTPL